MSLIYSSVADWDIYTKECAPMYIKLSMNYEPVQTSV